MNQQQTNLSKVKGALEAGLTLTVLTATYLCSTVDLRKYVSMLKQDGMNIISEPCENGNKKRFNKYYLAK